MGEEGEVEVRCKEPDGEQNCPRQRGRKKSQFPLAAAGSILWGPGSRGGCLDIRRRPRVEHVCLWLHGRVCLRKIGHVCSAHGRSGMQLGSKGVVSGPIESAFSCFHFQNKPRDASRPWAGGSSSQQKFSRSSCRVEESHCRSVWTDLVMHLTGQSRDASNWAGCRRICILHSCSRTPPSTGSGQRRLEIKIQNISRDEKEIKNLMVWAIEELDLER